MTGVEPSAREDMSDGLREVECAARNLRRRVERRGAVTDDAAYRELERMRAGIDHALTAWQQELGRLNAELQQVDLTSGGR